MILLEMHITVTINYMTVLDQNVLKLVNATTVINSGILGWI